MSDFDNNESIRFLIGLSTNTKKFYLYLTNAPRFFNEENPTVVETLGELENVPIIPAYRDDQEVTITKNGPCERYVFVNTRSEDVDDEKLSS